LHFTGERAALPPPLR